MTPEEKLWELIQRLHKRSREGSVAWEVAAGRREMYQVSFPNTTVRITEETGEADEPDYVILVLNEEGRIVERASDVQLRNSVEALQDIPGPSVTFTVMRELFQMARRKALGSEKVLDDLLSTLGDEPEDRP